VSIFNLVDQQIAGWSMWMTTCEDNSDCGSRDTCKTFWNNPVDYDVMKDDEAAYGCYSAGRGPGWCVAGSPKHSDCAGKAEDFALGDEKSADGKSFGMSCSEGRKWHMCDEQRTIIPQVAGQSAIGNALGALLNILYAYLAIQSLKAVRTRYQIPHDNIALDCVCGFCCPCLVACRMMRHLTPRVFQGCSYNATGSAGKDVWLWDKNTWPEQLSDYAAHGGQAAPAAHGTVVQAGGDEPKKKEHEFGTKFDPDTGDAIPQFDADTGRQNW
jgi:hypothetical protein